MKSRCIIQSGVLVWAAAMLPAPASGNGNPMSMVPEITGPFRVQLKLSLNAEVDPYHAIFHWTDEDAANENSIYFAYGTAGFKFEIADAANGYALCDTPSPNLPIVYNNLYDVRFEADGTNMKITVDNDVAVTCASTVVPSNVARTHYLAESPTATNPRLLGAVSGVMVVNTLDSPHPRDMYKFMNLPTQMLRTPTKIVASAYVRFDNVERNWQRWFDLSAGQFDHGITCVKPGLTLRMRCVVYDAPGGTTVHEPTINVVVEKEWAFWEFEIAENGDFIIRKDGAVVDTKTDTNGHPPGKFRPHSFFGGSIFTNAPNENFQGVILGFRIDVEDGS